MGGARGGAVSGLRVGGAADAVRGRGLQGEEGGGAGEEHGGEGEAGAGGRVDGGAGAGAGAGAGRGRGRVGWGGRAEEGEWGGWTQLVVGFVV